MKKVFIIAILVLILAAAGIAMLVVFSNRPNEEPVPFSSNEKPTNFIREGRIDFSNVSTKPSEPFLSYEENGEPVSHKLVLDALSACAAENGASPCIAMSVTLDVPFGGKQAIVEGHLQEDGSVLVRKMRRLQEGETPLVGSAGNIFISWPEARNLIAACKIGMVLQTHSLDVHLTFKDERRVVAVEPVIDEVFSVVQQAQPVCGSITIATE